MRWLSQAEEEMPGSPEWLSAREAERLARMRFAKRRNDFLLARWTAKRALALSLGLAVDPASLGAVEVRNAVDGAPEAFVDGQPAPLAISMTDRAGWAVCTVHPTGAAVGCDLELVEPRSAAFVTDYLTAAEQSVVWEAQGGDERDQLANLFWCAKESALKVLRTGLRRDTRSVEVTLSGQRPEAGWSRLQIRSEEGQVFPGWWRRYGQFLLTMAATLDTPPPEAIVEPPRLEAAVPTHYWMTQLS